MPISLVPTHTGDDRHVPSLTLTSGTFILGRSRSVDFFVDDPNASRRHARLTVGIRGVYIEDLDSKNGTLLNGTPVVTRMPLVVGDRLTIGTLTFVAQLDAHSDASHDEPSRNVPTDWNALSDQTERTLELLDILLSERGRSATHSESLVPLVVSAVDEVLDSVGTTRPSLTPSQALKVSQLIGALTTRAFSPSVYAWQTTARRRLDTLLRQSSPPVLARR
jgi:pSer/pThr/pTyr-binding forkhead associated (FHA) protein